jgi:hypothetical protein
VIYYLHEPDLENSCSWRYRLVFVSRNSRYQARAKTSTSFFLSLERRDDGDQVSVVYGTSRHLMRLKTGEVAITQAKNPAAYALTGLAYDTNFDFKVIVNLPWSDRYVKVPTRNPYGNTSKIRTLHATILRAIETAYQAALAR